MKEENIGKKVVFLENEFDRAYSLSLRKNFVFPANSGERFQTSLRALLNLLHARGVSPTALRACRLHPLANRISSVRKSAIPRADWFSHTEGRI